jgi:hypothetical protein
MVGGATESAHGLWRGRLVSRVRDPLTYQATSASCDPSSWPEWRIVSELAIQDTRWLVFFAMLVGESLRGENH